MLHMILHPRGFHYCLLHLMLPLILHRILHPSIPSKSCDIDNWQVCSLGRLELYRRFHCILADLQIYARQSDNTQSDNTLCVRVSTHCILAHAANQSAAAFLHPASCTTYDISCHIFSPTPVEFPLSIRKRLCRNLNAA